MNNFGHCDSLDYFPLKDGIKPSAMGLKRLKYDNPKKNQIFQIDEYYDKFIQNKKECMQERPSKYYRRALGYDLFHITQFMKKTLLEEYPEKFGESANKLSTFEDIVMSVPEDIVVHCFNDERDWAEVIHLCHANGWGAEENMNWTFDQIHEHVPRMKEIGQGEKVKRMMQGIVKSGNLMERIAAISFRTDSILNRHPQAKIEHKKFCLETNPNLFIRFERQTVKGFEKIGLDHDSPMGFLFTIRTYFVDVAQLEGDYLERVREAFQNPDPKVYSYEFLKNNRDQVLKWLENKK